MKLRELSKDEFAAYALTHEQNNFHQTLAWGELKATNGWRNYYVGLIDDNDKIIGASLLLSKKLVLNINLFYAPRGFLIDYKDAVILKTFTKLVKDFARKKKAIFIKIDPYVMYKEHDINGELVENGIDNSEVVDNLIKLGYKHKGFTVYQGTLQPRWMFVLDVENKTEDELLKEMYHPTTRHVITKTLKLGYDIIDVNLDNMQDFKDLMAKTSKRRGFIDRPLSYYQNMYKILSKYNMIKVLLVAFNCDDSIAKLAAGRKEKEDLHKNVLDKLAVTPNNKKYLTQANEISNSIDDANRKIKDIEDLKAEYGNSITMAGSMFIMYGDEVLYLYSGAYEEFLKYDAPYRLQWEMISYAVKNGYKRYNFYGISGAFNKEDESYGVYSFKRGFNGKVVELIGEFDLVINKPLYHLYNFSFKAYRRLKNLKHDK